MKEYMKDYCNLQFHLKNGDTKNYVLVSQFNLMPSYLGHWYRVCTLDGEYRIDFNDVSMMIATPLLLD